MKGSQEIDQMRKKTQENQYESVNQEACHFLLPIRIPQSENNDD